MRGSLRRWAVPLFGKRRYPELVAARKLIFTILSCGFNWSKTRIAEQFDVDPTTVWHQLQVAKAESIVWNNLYEEFCEMESV